MVGRFWYVDENSILRHKKESIKPNQTIFKKMDVFGLTDEGISTIIDLKPAMSEMTTKSEIRNSKSETNPKSEIQDQKSLISSNSVIPAKAGIQGETIDIREKTLDSRLHGNDKTFVNRESSIFNLQSSIPIRETLADVARVTISKLDARAQASIINRQLPAVEPPPAWKWTYLPTPTERFASAVRSPYALLSPTLAAVIFLVAMTAMGNSRLHPSQTFADISSSVSSLENASAANVAEAASAIQSLPQIALQSIENIAAGAGETLASAWSSMFSGTSSLASNALSLIASNDSSRPSNSLAVGGTDAVNASSSAGSSANANATVVLNGGVDESADVGVGSEEPPASSVIPPGEQGKVTAEHGGVVILPPSGSPSDQVKLEKSIQNSFSDAVTVRPNPDGTTGVIQPVFRTVAGHDFLYVLVPVKATSTSAVN